jgi:putative tryptophan/tyrosine transport system substrate-binding protein
MRRRDFIAGIAGSAATWAAVARGQQPAMPVVGFLHTATPEAGAGFVTAFRKGLREIGYVEGQNVAIEYQWANNQNDRLAELAVGLVRRKVSLIVASPTPATLAAKAATTSIPIVFQVGPDPVKLGLVASLSRPGGNLTGISQLSTTLVGKRLELLHALAPNASVVGLLADPQSPNFEEQVRDLQEAASALGLRPITLNGREIDSVFANAAQRQINAFFVMASAYFYSIPNQIASLAARHKMPVIYESREFAAAGGLASYGVDFSDVYRQVGVYAGKILSGEKPGELPVLQPIKFELIINRKAAKEIGLTLPDKLLTIADEVIE